jgi:hypothetical protein
MINTSTIQIIETPASEASDKPLLNMGRCPICSLPLSEQAIVEMPTLHLPVHVACAAAQAERLFLYQSFVQDYAR